MATRRRPFAHSLVWGGGWGGSCARQGVCVCSPFARARAVHERGARVHSVFVWRDVHHSYLIPTSPSPHSTPIHNIHTPCTHTIPTAAAQDVIKISVLGTGGVGKSAITLRYVRDRFVEDWDPTIEDAYRKTVDVDGTICTLEILDTAGQDDFESLRPQWMIGKDGYLFVYSMDSQRSLKELEPFVELHRELNEQQRVPIVLVANKKDLVRARGFEWARGDLRRLGGASTPAFVCVRSIYWALLSCWRV